MSATNSGTTSHYMRLISLIHHTSNSNPPRKMYINPACQLASGASYTTTNTTTVKLIQYSHNNSLLTKSTYPTSIENIKWEQREAKTDPRQESSMTGGEEKALIFNLRYYYRGVYDTL